jgi:DNA-binding MarR family transcriptional regulator
VVITEKGQELLKRLDAKNEEMDRMMGDLTEEEAEQLSSLLDKLRASREDAPGELELGTTKDIHV